MKKIFLGLIAVSLGLTAAFAGAWVREYTKEGITVSTMEVAGSPMKAFRGEGMVNAPAEAVTRVLQDVPGLTSWMPDCVASKTLQKKSENEIITYNETRAPVVDNRDIVVYSKSVVMKDRVVITMKAVNRPDLMPEKPGKVRIKDMDGRWELIVKGNQTYVIYQVRANPAGKIPTWLANQASTDMPFKTIKGLRARLARAAK